MTREQSLAWLYAVLGRHVQEKALLRVTFSPRLVRCQLFFNTLTHKLVHKCERLSNVVLKIHLLMQNLLHFPVAIHFSLFLCKTAQDKLGYFYL